MAHIHSRLFLGLALWCILSAGSLVQANEPIALHIVVTIPSSQPGFMPQDTVSAAPSYEMRSPRIDPLDLPRLAETLKCDLTPAPEIAGGTLGQSHFPLKRHGAAGSLSAGSNPLRVLILIQASNGSGSTIATTGADASTSCSLSIEVAVGTQVHQPARAAQYLPRAMYVSATPNEKEAPVPARVSVVPNLDRRSEVGARGAFDLSMVTCLNTLPDLGNAQPLPEF
jgi:hypothetical protein